MAALITPRITSNITVGKHTYFIQLKNSGIKELDVNMSDKNKIPKLNKFYVSTKVCASVDSGLESRMLSNLHFQKGQFISTSQID